MAVGILMLSVAAAASNEPSHPLSHIHPTDIDLNMTGNDIFNVSEFRLRSGFLITNYEFRDDTNTQVLLYNTSEDRWEIVSSDLDLNDNNIENFFQGKCSSGKAVGRVYPNGSYNCVNLTQSLNDLWVDESGDTMTGDLNLSGNDLIDPGNITSFFAPACSGANEVVKGIFPNGSYTCVDASTLSSTEDLQTTLGAGNWTGGIDINMTGSALLDYFQDGVCGPGDVLDGVYPNGTYRCVSADSETSTEGLQATLQANNWTGGYDINMTGSSLLDFFGSACGTDEAVKNIFANGSVTCTSTIDTGQDVENLNETLTAGNLANQSIFMTGNDINGIGSLNTGGQSFSIGASVNMSFNDINQPANINDYFQSSVCPSGQVVDGINADGSYQCVDVDEGSTVENLSTTLNAGNRAFDNLNLTFTGNITNINRIEDFFASACGSGQVVEQVNPDGTYSCVDPSEDIQTEDLNQTLLAGNLANQSIYMVGNDIVNPGEVDGLDLDNPGDGIDVSGNQYIVDAGQTLAFSSGSLVVAQDVLNDSYITDNSLTSLSLATDSVGNSEIAPEAVNNDSVASFSSFTLRNLELTSDLTGDGVVDTLQLSDSSVTTSKIAGGAVTNPKLAFNSVNRSQIIDGEVRSSEIGSGQVGTTEIASDAVTNTELSNTDYFQVYDLNITNNLNMSFGSIDDISSLNRYFQSSTCPSGQVVDGINADGSYQCVDVDEGSTVENLSTTLNAGNRAFNDINLTGSDITNVANIRDFFANTCSGSNEVVKRVYANGTYVCDTIPEDTGTENLAETLSAGNYSDGQDIYMNGSSAVRFENGVRIGTASTVAGDDGDVAIGLGADSGGLNSAVAIGESSQAVARYDIAIGFASYSDSLSGAAEYGATALGYDANATGDKSLALGTEAHSRAEAAVAIGRSSNAPNAYEATFGNLGSQKLDVNVTGNLTVHGEFIDLPNGGEVRGVVSNSGGDAVNRSFVLNNASVGTDDQTLAEVLTEGDEANGQAALEFGSGLTNITSTGAIEAGADIDVSGNNLGNVNEISGDSGPVQVANDVEMTGSTPKIDMGNGMSVQRVGGDMVISD